jgi:hypothetical protein
VTGSAAPESLGPSIEAAGVLELLMESLLFGCCTRKGKRKMISSYHFKVLKRLIVEMAVA